MDIKNEKKFDVAIVGGSTTGVAAALSAAEEGAKVCIIEKYGFLGGAAANQLIGRFQIGPNIDGEPIIQGAFKNICERLSNYNAIEGSWRDSEAYFDPEMLKYVCIDMCEEAGVTSYLHSLLIDVEMQNENHLDNIIISNGCKKQKINANVYIDATGNGNLATLAGAEFNIGRPFDGLTEPMTLLFNLNNVDLEEFKSVKVEEIWPKFKKETGISKTSRGKIVMWPSNPIKNTMTFCTIHISNEDINVLDFEDLSSVEFEARKLALLIYKFFKENVLGFQDSELLTANEIGIRESRRIKGDYVLSRLDILSGRKFDDSIGCSTGWIDLHNPEGEGVLHEYISKDDWWEIPYRSLTVNSKNNILVSGRCISVDHEGYGATREMPVCIMTGQAAGIAAALSSEKNIKAKEVDIDDLQKKLISQGVWLKN